MAISFTKQPSGRYPAYNDSYIQFTSTLSGGERAEITLTPAGTFPNNFVIYPDGSGVYTFNFKEALRVILNESGFEDPDDTYPVAWNKDFDYGYVLLNPTITVYNAVGGSESTSPFYNFIRGIKQIGEEVFSNDYQLLLPSTNGIDYDLPYWEGFPLSFEVQRPASGESLRFTNLNTGDSTSDMPVTTTGSHRIFIDKVSTNWTSSIFLPLADVKNRLELSSGIPPASFTFRTNLNVHKRPERCGVYLKWFNSDGGYSYFLFDEFYKKIVDNQSIGVVQRNEFLNVADGLKNPFRNIGKEAGEKWRLKATINEVDRVHLESLFLSPSVQLWTSQTPYVAGSWIDVQLSDPFEIATKKRLNELFVNIQLPNKLTAQL